MNGLLVIGEASAGAADPGWLAALTLAEGLRSDPAEPIYILVVHPEERLARAFAVDGVTGVLHVPAEPSADAIAHAAASAMADRRPRVVLAGLSLASAAYGARLAIEADAAFADHVVAAATGPGLAVTCETDGGRTLVDLAFEDDRAAVLLVRATGPASVSRRSDASIPVSTRFPATGERIRSERLATRVVEGDGVQLARAPLVLAVGRGIVDAEGVAAARALAGRLGAVLVGTRPVVDAGWLPRNRLVGLSGTTVSPATYLAFGVSGATEHLAGVRGPRVLAAVNTDPDAPIRDRATHVAVADARSVVDAMIAHLESGTEGWSTGAPLATGGLLRSHPAGERRE